MTRWSIVPLPLDGPLFEGAIAVYGEAFALPPYSDPDRGREVRARLREVHAYREGFRALCALSDAGEVVGMTYGYRGRRGQWWHDTVVAAVDAATAARWFSDAYELVEIAVHPRWQGRGIGTALIATLLEGLPYSTCVLSTRTDSRAHLLYRRLGFEVITEMRFSPAGAPFYIMGRPLPFDVAVTLPQTPLPERRR